MTSQHVKVILNEVKILSDDYSLLKKFSSKLFN